MRPLFFISFLFLLTFSHAQNSENDSLKKILVTSREDTSKVYILNRLAKIEEVHNPVLSLQYAKQAFSLAHKLHFTKGKAMALVYQADFFYFRGNADSAEKKYEEAIRLFGSIKDKGGQALAYMVAANNFTNDGRYEKAIKYVLSSVEMNEQLGNTTNYGWAMQTAGSIFAQLGVYDKSVEYTGKALEVMQKAGNEDGIAACYNTLGIVNDYTGNYEKALAYYAKALALREKKDNVIEVINIKSNMGVVYMYSGIYGKAVAFLKDAMRLSQQAGQPGSMASSLINLGETYLNMKNFTLSVSSLQEGIALADTLGMLEYKQEGIRLLAEAHFARGDHKAAFENSKLYDALKDTIQKASSSRQIFEMNSRYEAARKDKDLLLKEAELSKQTAEGKQKSLQRNSFVIAFGLMIILAFFIFRGYRQNQKINAEVTHQKHLLEEKQKEILDSIYYARRIQRALITPEKYIEKVLKKNA